MVKLVVPRLRSRHELINGVVSIIVTGVIDLSHAENDERVDFVGVFVNALVILCTCCQAVDIVK